MKRLAGRAVGVVLALAVLAWRAPAAAAPAEYVVGGGDGLQVTVWKNVDLSQAVTVRPDGKITLPLIGDVQAAGLTALQIAQALAEKFSSFVNAPNVTVTVTAATGYRVYTQGAIANGMFTLVAPITARQLLAQAGGATPEADLSRAYVLRGSERVPANLSVAAGGQESGAGPLLAPGDILVVPVREVTLGRVLVVGEVAQPHALPYQDGMTILDAYLGAGGGTATADLRGVKIARQQGGGGSVEMAVDLEAVLKQGALQQNAVLAPGDIVIVPFKQAPERVLVVGEVRTPQTLPYREGLTVLDAFVAGGGATDFADLGAVKVVRPAPDGKKTEIKVDLSRILKRADLAQNVALAPGDIVMVPR